jgi:hypothetical protein
MLYYLTPMKRAKRQLEQLTLLSVVQVGGDPYTKLIRSLRLEAGI